MGSYATDNATWRINNEEYDRDVRDSVLLDHHRVRDGVIELSGERKQRRVKSNRAEIVRALLHTAIQLSMSAAVESRLPSPPPLIDQAPSAAPGTASGTVPNDTAPGSSRRRSVRRTVACDDNRVRNSVVFKKLSTGS
ncbi:MAG: hypothetical protein ABIS06_11050 [Vicinamibacterales bacterium]